MKLHDDTITLAHRNLHLYELERNVQRLRTELLCWRIYAIGITLALLTCMALMK